jgi:hypothetical protein
MAFAQLYGAAHEVVVNLGSDESGHAIEQREVRFTVQMGGQQHELTLQCDRLVQRDFRAVNLNDPPRLNDDAGVFWNPLLGWSTHESNIHVSRDIFETIVMVVIIAAVSYVSAGTLGPWVAGALGATAGTLGAAVIVGAVVGATTSVVSGAISGNFSWRNVLQGMVLGGVGGAMTFGVGELAQSAGQQSFIDSARDAGGSVTTTTQTAGSTLSNPGLNLSGISVEGLTADQLQTFAQNAQQTFSTVRTVGTVVQSGITSELGGGDFEDGVLAGLGNMAASGVGNQVTQGLVDNQWVGEPMARVIGGVATAGVSSAIVNARGGDGDRAFMSGVVDTAVGFLPPASSLVQPEPGSNAAHDYRNGSDVESDAADAARREHEWAQQSDAITARRGAETAPDEVSAAVPGSAPDIGDGLAPAVPGGAHAVDQGEPTPDATPPRSGAQSGAADSVPVPCTGTADDEWRRLVSIGRRAAPSVDAARLRSALDPPRAR